jgi:hypothetical protein
LKYLRDKKFKRYIATGDGMTSFGRTLSGCTAKPLTGYRSNGRTFKVYLDGYNLMDMLAGNAPGFGDPWTSWRAAPKLRARSATGIQS